jgi:hypothetical protein
MKIITAAMARKNTDEKFKNVQRLFIKRLTEISKSGNSSATFNPKDYHGNLNQLLGWLESLNFVCNKEDEDCVRITW